MEQRTYWVVWEWADNGERHGQHWITTDIVRSREVDEANRFLPRRWVSVEECPAIVTCTHTRDFRG